MSTTTITQRMRVTSGSRTPSSEEQRIRKAFIQQLSASGVQFTDSTLMAVNTFFSDVQSMHAGRVQQLEHDVQTMRRQRAAIAQLTDSLRTVLADGDVPQVPPTEKDARTRILDLVRWLDGRDARQLQNVRGELEQLVTVLTDVSVPPPLLNGDINMGYDALHVPSINTTDAASMALLASGCVLNFKHYLHTCDKRVNDNGDCGIHIAVINGDLREVQRHCVALRLQQLSVDVFNDEDLTPLHLAIVHDAGEPLVGALLQYGAQCAATTGDECNALHLAVEHANLDVLVRCMRAHHVAVDAACVNRHNADGHTPLHLAAIHGRRDEAAQLVQMRAIIDLDVRDKKSGRSAIYHAAEADNVAIVKILMESGASVHVKTYAGTSIVEALCDSDADFSKEMRKLFYSERMAYVKASVAVADGGGGGGGDDLDEDETRRKRRKT